MLNYVVRQLRTMFNLEVKVSKTESFHMILKASTFILEGRED